MAKKNLIISAFTGYRFDQIKPYVHSIRDNVADADLVMVVGHTDSATKTQLTTLGWQLVDLPAVTDIPIHVLRFLPMYNFLYNNSSQYEFVVSTDVKDVIFQQDPFTWLAANLGSRHLVAGSEALRYCDEPWGDENLRTTYGGYAYQHHKNNVIYNVGTLGGRAEYMRDLFFTLFYNSLGRPIPVVDQAVFNVTIQSRAYQDAVLFAEQKLAWACQAGTVADPAKMNLFRPKLLEPEPVWRDNTVYTSTGIPFVIVHQYDRVPEWASAIVKKFHTSNLTE